MERKRRATSSETSGKQTQEIRTPEALLNDLVLERLFKYLGYQDLRSCRNVKNSVWHKNLKKPWWSYAKVVFKKGDNLADKILDYLNQTEINSIAVNYKFESYGPAHKPFLDKFGNSIKSLELFGCMFPTIDSFRQLLYTQCLNLQKLIIWNIDFEENTANTVQESLTWQEPKYGKQPNLKSLKVRYVGRKMDLPYMELLSHFSNLESIEAIVNHVNIYGVISTIRKHDPEMLKLNHINIHDLSKIYDDMALSSVLLDPSLSFEKLATDVGSCELETLVNILDLQAKSLKDICIYSEGCRHPTLRLPREPLKNLKNLTIEYCLFPSDIFKFTPNVTKVHLNYDGSHNLLFKGADPNIKVDTCKELTLLLYGEWRATPQSDFVFFLNTFPNVETLEISGLNNRKFSMICERWTKLVYFTIASCSVNTTGLLGFDPDSYDSKKIRKPNITNLKDLCRFSMVSIIYQNEAKDTPGNEIKNGSVILKELESLSKIERFLLKDYKNNLIGKKTFAKYSGR